MEKEKVKVLTKEFLTLYAGTTFTVIDIVNGQLIDREETQTYAITLEFK